MRIRLIFNPPLTPCKCWYEITENLTIKDLAKCILKDFRHTQHAHPKSLKLELDGFELYKRGTTGGLLKENDIVNVQLRKGAKVSVESEPKGKLRIQFFSFFIKVLIPVENKFVWTYV